MMGGLFHKDNYNGLVGGISGGGGIGFLYKHLCPGVNLHVLGAGLKEQHVGEWCSQNYSSAG